MHDAQCESEYIYPPGGWLPCGCLDRHQACLSLKEEK